MSNRPVTREQAIGALGLTQSRTAVRPLLRALESSDSSDRLQAVYTLEDLGTLAIEAVPALERTTKDPSLGHLASQALVKIKAAQEKK